MPKKTFFFYVIVFYALSLTIVAECGAKSSTILGSRWGMPVLEQVIAGQLAGYIYNCSLASGYASYDRYGSSTTTNNVYQAANGMGHAYSISFYGTAHGDWELWWPSDKHWKIQVNDGAWVSDNGIFPHTESQRVRFAFLWSCLQGDVKGGNYYWTGAYGMPYCWLHTNDLSEDGYDSPDGHGYTFIGFQGPAPLFWIDDFGSRAGYRFAGNFYRWALWSGVSINDALDYAAYQVWGATSFADCIYDDGYTLEGDFGRMRVYGDGSLQIGSSAYNPPLPPPPNVGGGCPTLFVWDGVNYVDHGVIDIHKPSGEDIIREVAIQPEDVGMCHHKVKFRLREGYPGLRYSKSVIDQVKLYIVDNKGKNHLCPLESAKHSVLENVLPLLLRSDDRKLQMLLLETVDLTFVVPYKNNNIREFTFVIEGCNEEKIPL
jgi:hypothetical protein